VKNFDRNRRALRWAAALLLLLPPLPAHASGHKSEARARSQFATAERMREALNGRPAEERTRQEYQRVMTAYRRVYHGAPAATKADSSVVAVAQLLAEMGRRFDNADKLRAAVGQYEFLRREYPGSKYRFDALFTIGEIYQDDLGDTARARTVFKEFLRRYPRNHLAEQARKALAEPVQSAALRSREENDTDDSADSPKARPARESPGAEPQTAVDAKTGRPPRVTGLRHWSTPDYTRVAIDLEQDIKYESQRIHHPDRIFFDLLDTSLATALVGKTFDVDDGFLKKIRIAQFQPGKTRVVLEVDSLSDYDAFLLPNPSRLIIDIHGQDVHGQLAKVAETGDRAQAKDAAVKSGAIQTAVASGKPSRDTSAAKIFSGKKPGTDNKKSTPPLAVPGSAAPKKTIVEADDENSDAAAKLDPPELKPASKITITPVPASPELSPPDRASSEQASLGQPTSGQASAASALPRQALSGQALSGHTSSRTPKGKRKSMPAEPDVHEAQPTASGDRSLIRALGLKIGKIVIDPGHGGHDTGTIGPHGLEEKDLVLDIGRRLGKLLQTRLGADVVYTRTDDTFIPLETRTAIANQEQADLFVSIHANSSDDPGARGVETYYLNFTSSREALEVAARENAVSEKSIHELQDLVKKIALKEKIEESQEFASDVQHALYSGLGAKSPGIRNRGVKKAPFIVLIGANMPSILAEISFVSNPGDERKLRTLQYRQRIAESLYRGISKYVSGLSGVKVASKIDKGAGQ
jgi:N-acetylmuramoyl-L-alanine amidase